MVKRKRLAITESSRFLYVAFYGLTQKLDFKKIRGTIEM